MLRKTKSQEETRHAREMTKVKLSAHLFFPSEPLRGVESEAWFYLVEGGGGGGGGSG